MGDLLINVIKSSLPKRLQINFENNDDVKNKKDAQDENERMVLNLQIEFYEIQINDIKKRIERY